MIYYIFIIIEIFKKIKSFKIFFKIFLDIKSLLKYLTKVKIFKSQLEVFVLNFFKKKFNVFILYKNYKKFFLFGKKIFRNKKGTLSSSF